MQRAFIFASAVALLMVALLAGFSPARAETVVTDSPVVATASSAALFVANLSPAQETSAVESIASGRAVMALSGDAAPYTLIYRVSIADIDNVSAAHIHIGAPGVAGVVVFPLFSNSGGAVFDPSTPISGTLSLDDTQRGDLLAGNYYVNVHSTDFPAGEIRGQLGAFTPPTNYSAPLLGKEEVPAVDTPAAGIARFTLVTTDTLTYQIDVADISNITLAHIHRAPSGKNGSPSFTLYSGSGLFDPNYPLSGSVILNPQDWVDLLTGFFYVNVHTSGHPGGEMRGQIGGTQLYSACLCGARETPPVTSDASGYGVMALAADGTTLAYRVEVDNITDITAAHIHRGGVGVNGSVVFPLFTGAGSFDPENPASGTLTLAPDQAIDLIAGRYYVNVHTARNGGGEIRGQMEAYAPSPHMLAALAGRHEVPAVDTSAVGVGRLTLNVAADTLHYTVAVTNVTGISAAHIHKGLPTVSGPVLAPIFTGGASFSPEQPVGGGVTLSAQNWVDLLTGYTYINVHTAGHGGGELRGQIGGPRVFQATLSGLNEAPPVTTTLASGTGILALNAEATALTYRIGVEEISGISAAHIHKGAVGVPGGVVFPLFNGSGTFDPANPISGTLPLSNVNVFDLIAGNYYVNVHTPTHAGGEIRGQIEEYLPAWNYAASLSGANEVPAVETSAFGQARLLFDAGSGALRYSVSVSNTLQATAAHIHREKAGVNGPVVFPLFSNGSGAVLDASNPLGGCLWLNAENIVDLLTDYYYVNVHTAANGKGEIRGQIGELRSVYMPLVESSAVAR